MKLNLFACGDIFNATKSNNFITSELQEIISNADISMCNFEAPIEHTGMKSIPKVGPHLFQSEDTIEYLQSIGFNIVSLANNHIYDFGSNGIIETINKLKLNRITYIGAGINFEEAYKTQIIIKNGLKIGFISACENQFGCLYDDLKKGGYAWIYHDLIDDNVRILRSECDFVILSAHAGVEDINFPICEWRKRYKRLCDLGVDVIIGHHPHVPQGIENYNNSLIFYSLGNFYFDNEEFRFKSDDSFSIIIQFEKHKKTSYELIFHKKNNNQVCKSNVDDVNFKLDVLNSLIHVNLEQNTNEISIYLYKKYYHNYYRMSVGMAPIDISFFKKIKIFIRNLIFKNKVIRERNLILLHNIRIDSHRFIVQRALSLLSESNDLN